MGAGGEVVRQVKVNSKGQARIRNGNHSVLILPVISIGPCVLGWSVIDKMLRQVKLYYAVLSPFAGLEYVSSF